MPLDRPHCLAGRIAVAVCLLATLAFGIYPNPLQKLAQSAVTSSEAKVAQR